MICQNGDSRLVSFGKAKPDASSTTRTRRVTGARVPHERTRTSSLAIDCHHRQPWCKHGKSLPHAWSHCRTGGHGLEDPAASKVERGKLAAREPHQERPASMELRAIQAGTVLHACHRDQFHIRPSNHPTLTTCVCGLDQALRQTSHAGLH